MAEMTANIKIPKRERTRQQLVTAAVKVFAEKGFDAAAIQEIAAVAGVANGTFYNYFPTKESILESAAIHYGVSYCQRIVTSYAHITDGAERMAIGGRHYMTLAVEQPETARFMLSVAVSSSIWDEQIRPFVLADLMMGIRQKRFHVASKEAAMDLITGTNMAAMHSLLSGAVGRSHITAIAASILRGLGMDPKEADKVARRPLPPLPPAA